MFAPRKPEYKGRILRVFKTVLNIPDGGCDIAEKRIFESVIVDIISDGQVIFLKYL